LGGGQHARDRCKGAAVFGQGAVGLQRLQVDHGAITFVAGTSASPDTIASANTSSAGRRLPSTSTLLGLRRNPCTARCIASIVACRMLRRSISSTEAIAMLQHSALAQISS
jgi:hypothetical protein